MATVKTIKEEREAIAKLLADTVGLKGMYDHEPQQLGQTPVATVYFAGFGIAEPANFRMAKQLRQYQIRLYVALEGDWGGAQELHGTVFEKLWEKVISIKRLNDNTNVIISHTGEAKVEMITDDQERKYILGTIMVETEHRSPYTA